MQENVRKHVKKAEETLEVKLVEEQKFYWGYAAFLWQWV